MQTKLHTASSCLLALEPVVHAQHNLLMQWAYLHNKLAGHCPWYLPRLDLASSNELHNVPGSFNAK